MATYRLSVRAVFITLSIVIPTGSATAATPYTVTDLGTLFGGQDQAYGINDSGQVVGTSGSRAVVYANGTVTDLGILPGGTSSIGLGINNSGQMAGYANTSGAERGFIYSDSAMTPLGSLTGGTSNAYGINDSGQVVGSSVASNGSLHAVLYSADGTPADLGTLGGAASHANAINNNGQIVGSASALVTYFDVYGNPYSVPYSVEETHAFLYSGGVMKDLGTLSGASSSRASGLNNNGQVVGESGGKAFLYSNGVMTGLSTLPGWGTSNAFSINDQGQIVGAAYIWENNGPFIDQRHAVIVLDGVMTDLNSLIEPGSQWILEEARDINNSGQIVGFGKLNGQTRAFLVTPVPLPGAVWFFGSGLIALMAIRRRKAS